MARFKKSFYDWCIENGKNEFIDLWDYKLNNCSPKDISYGSAKKYFFKCSRELHDSEEKIINNLTSGHTEFKCNCCNSFEQWCIDNGKEYWLDLWDYKLNKCSPKDIGYASRKECYYFKCPRGLHKSEEKRISDLTIVKINLTCKCCNSFEQWCIDNNKTQWLDLWDYKLNNCSPKDISYGSNKKYYFKCERGLHDSEQKMICNLTNGNTEFKCNCCNSFGQWCIDNYETQRLDLWDCEKNGNLNPFKISRGSNKKVWIKCQKDEKHDSYFVSCRDFTLYGVRCPICKESHGERKIREYLRKNNIEFIAQKAFSNLLGTGNKPLSYDFYVPSKDLLIEFQGIQHYEPTDFNNEGMEQAEKNFKKQQEHDRRKREYAQQNNITLLEITYLDEDKIEEILDGIFK